MVKGDQSAFGQFSMYHQRLEDYTTKDIPRTKIFSPKSSLMLEISYCSNATCLVKYLVSAMQIGRVIHQLLMRVDEKKYDLRLLLTHREWFGHIRDPS
jgi:hypothetical protein